MITTTPISVHADALRVRRFSEGMERVAVAPSALRIGRFSDGCAEPLAPSPDRVGSFADGLVGRPNAFEARRMGSFGDVAPARRRAPGISPARTVAPAEA